VDDAVRTDAEQIAKDMGISVEDAIRRLENQDSIGRLGAALEQYEAETFAGLWIQHAPTYRVVVAFTRDGEETIQPYIEHLPFADLIEVRSVAVNYAELRAIQQEAHQLLDPLGLSVSSGVNVQQNVVELYVTDRRLFDETLQSANVRLPAHVHIITTYQPLGDELPFAVTPEPGIHVPQLRMRSSAFMSALIEGTLVVKDGCLRVVNGEGDSGHLVIWQTDYFVNNNAGVIEILDRDGDVVARVGETIRMGGGEISMTDELKRQLREPLSKQCAGPYWLMGDIVKGV
jgi:antitoxin component of RelBE/YafQ-DinJ toxin-antitoxin module